MQPGAADPVRGALLATALLVAAAGLPCCRAAEEDAASQRTELFRKAWRGHELLISGPPTWRAGVAGEVGVELRPTGRFELAVDFPTTLRVGADRGARVDPAEQTRGDAVRHGSDGYAFRVRVRPERAGGEALHAALRFGLCEGEICTPVSREVSFDVEVR